MNEQELITRVEEDRKKVQEDLFEKVSLMFHSVLGVYPDAVPFDGIHTVNYNTYVHTELWETWLDGYKFLVEKSTIVSRIKDTPRYSVYQITNYKNDSSYFTKLISRFADIDLKKGAKIKKKK